LYANVGGVLARVASKILRDIAVGLGTITSRTPASADTLRSVQAELITVLALLDLVFAGNTCEAILTDAMLEIIVCVAQVLSIRGIAEV
jgi:nicotinamide riboside transporter PnuC